MDLYKLSHYKLTVIFIIDRKVRNEKNYKSLKHIYKIIVVKILQVNSKLLVIKLYGFISTILNQYIAVVKNHVNSAEINFYGFATPTLYPWEIIH